MFSTKVHVAEMAAYAARFSRGNALAISASSKNRATGNELSLMIENRERRNNFKLVARS